MILKITKMSLTFHEQTEEDVCDECCKTCEQTDIEICYDCGECADPSLPNRCCECEEEEEERCFHCDRNAYHKNDWHCNQGKEKVEEVLDSNGNSNSDYKKAEKECPIGYIVVWNRWEKGFKYRKLDKDGYMESL